MITNEIHFLHDSKNNPLQVKFKVLKLLPAVH